MIHFSMNWNIHMHNVPAGLCSNYSTFTFIYLFYVIIYLGWMADIIIAFEYFWVYHTEIDQVIWMWTFCFNAYFMHHIFAQTL